MLVKVLAVEGNRIRLSRKAILKEQRAKMGGEPLPEGVEEGAAPASSPALTIEGGAEFDDDEPNFNRDAVGAAPGGGSERPPDRDRGPRGGGGGRPGGGGGGRGRRRPGGGGGGGRGGHGGGHGGPRR